MPRVVHIDCETFSACDIMSAGAIKYARHPSTECLMVAYQIEDDAFGDSPVALWDCTTGAPMPADLRDALDDPETLLVAFNASFEIAIFEACLGVPADLERWECAQVLALSFGLPQSLADVCLALELGSDKAKLKEGRALIQKFSVPQKKDGRRILPGDDPEAWARFCEYCRRDVVAETEIYRRLTA